MPESNTPTLAGREAPTVEGLEEPLLRDLEAFLYDANGGAELYDRLVAFRAARISTEPPSGDMRARTWAWQQVREQVGTENWTAGESATYFGFFCWGWNYKCRLETQRADGGYRSPGGITSIDEMCAILKEHYIKSDERTDCALLYRVTFDQLRGLYDRGRAAAGTDEGTKADQPKAADGAKESRNG